MAFMKAYESLLPIEPDLLEYIDVDTLHESYEVCKLRNKKRIHAKYTSRKHSWELKIPALIFLVVTLPTQEQRHIIWGKAKQTEKSRRV